jgi:hypothetical protein
VGPYLFILQGLARDLQLTDYDRIEFYGRRIKELSLSAHYPSRAVPYSFKASILPIIWSRRPNLAAPLLPRLSFLEISLEDFHGFAARPRCLIGPTLTDIEIDALDYQYLPPDRADHPWTNVHDILKRFASNVKSFTINARADGLADADLPPHFGMPTPIIELYSSFFHLEKLVAPSIELNSATLSHFARLPKLEMIVASISFIELNQFSSTSISDSEFPRLKVLSLATTHLDACSKLLIRPGFRELESLTIVRRRGGDFWDLTSFFESLDNQHTYSRLKTLRLQSFDIDWYPPNGNAQVSDITPKTLEHLSLFENMAEFCIDLDQRVDMDNQSLQYISDAWPNLRILQLRERRMGSVPSVTLSGLLSFVAACRKLESLSIRVNALHFNNIGEILPRAGQNIHTFDACTSPMTDFEGIMSFLIVAFPNLKKLDYGWCLHRSLDQIYATDDEHLYLECWGIVSQSMDPIMRSKWL